MTKCTNCGKEIEKVGVMMPTLNPKERNRCMSCFEETAAPKEYTATFSGKRYEQLERLSEKGGSKLLVITRALDLLEAAKNV